MTTEGDGRESQMAGGRAGALARGAVVVVFVLSTGIGLGLGALGGVLSEYEPAWMLPFGAFALVGALVVGRQPGNAIGWLFAAIGVLPGLGLGAEILALYLGGAGASVPVVVQVVGAWAGSGWYWYTTMVMLLVFVPLLFPDGRPVTRRWGIVAWTAGSMVAILFVLAGVAEHLADGVRNPLGVPGVPALDDNPLAPPLLIVALGCAVLAMASMVVRYRRSDGVQRRQMKWMVFAASAVVALMVVDPDVSALPGVVGSLLYPAVVALIPIAAGVAILRYRLFEIDRLVSRTVSYGLVLVVLAGVYAGGVLLLGTILPLSSELAVAGSTLAIAALFRPLVRRVRSSVDRRFDRARYDAAQTVETFAQRLRAEVDLYALSAEVEATASRTMQPQTAHLWLVASEMDR